jgi:hypothetical protein
MCVRNRLDCLRALETIGRARDVQNAFTALDCSGVVALRRTDAGKTQFCLHIGWLL